MRVRLADSTELIVFNVREELQYTSDSALSFERRLVLLMNPHPNRPSLEELSVLLTPSNLSSIEVVDEGGSVLKMYTTYTLVSAISHQLPQDVIQVWLKPSA